MPRIPFEKLYPKGMLAFIRFYNVKRKMMNLANCICFYFPCTANPLAIDLLNKLLCFDPALRITVEEALAHPYLSAYHDEDDEPVHHQHFDFSFESVEAMDDMRKLIAQEVMSFKASKQAMLQPQLSPGANLRRKDRQV